MRKFNLSVLRPGTSEEYSGFIDGSANVWGIKAKIQIKDEEIKLDLSGLGEAIVTLWLKPEEESLFPLLPGFMVGYNRPEDTGPYYPQIAPKQDMNHPNMLSPYWGIRADRATIPAAFLFGKNKCWAISVPPYIDNPGKKHTTNGLRVCLKRGVGISIGFINEPVHFVKSVYAPGSKEYHNFKGKTTVVCQYHQGLSNGRSGHAVFVKRLYKFFHEKGPKGDGLKATVKMVSDALVKDILIPAQTTLKKERFGEFFKIKDGKPARSLIEIGWTGGAMLAYPFLAMQSRYKKQELADYAVQRLDKIAAGVNINSGFFWDCQEDEALHSKGWWAGGPKAPDNPRQAHYAYTQGHACYYLIKSAYLNNKRGECWVSAAGKVLDKALEFQQKNGQFPVSYSLKDGAPIRTVGFAGCWFAAALGEFYGWTGEKKYLRAAIKAVNSYHSDVVNLQPCATPMDTHNATDQEGNLALLHAAVLIHKHTREKKYLEILKDSADYEMLWRYYYNTRTPFAPLDTAAWGSSGGSVTSAHNPHIHPMHLNSLDQVLYLADKTGDDYYLERTKDAVRYGCACVCRPSEDFGWGKPGWLCERFCPSDGLIIQHHPKTGVPWATSCDYHPWNAGVLLEGFTGEAWNRFKDLA